MEIPRGRCDIKVALPPGKYLVRKITADGNYTREFSVALGATNQIDEHQLTLTGLPSLALKGGDPAPAVTATTVPAHLIELRLALGVAFDWPANSTGLIVQNADAGGPQFAGRFSAVWGLTHRLNWGIGTAAFAYRFGQRGKVEVVPWGGMTSWGLGYSSIEKTIFTMSLGLGAGVRGWLSPNQSLMLTADGSSSATFSQLRNDSPTTWRVSSALGYSATVKNFATFSLGLSVSENLLWQGHFPGAAGHDSQVAWAIDLGAVQSLGLRPLPLIQLHLARWFSLDLYAGVGYEFAPERWRYSTLAGGTFSF